jgi:hypothetical protein
MIRDIAGILIGKQTQCQGVKSVIVEPRLDPLVQYGQQSVIERIDIVPHSIPPCASAAHRTYRASLARGKSLF